MTRAPAAAALLDALSDGMYVVEPSRRITYWNGAAEAISGFSADEMVGRWCGDGRLNHVNERGVELCGASCPLLATMRDGRTRSVRVFLHHRDGHVRPVNVTAVALYAEDGTISGAVETFRDDSDRRELEQDLREAEHLALVDPLTGVGNRRALKQCLSRRLADWERDGARFAALVIDVDRFKQTNDNLGHDAGDAVLTVLARSLVLAVRSGDQVVRTGGDEFAVITGPITDDELSSLRARLHVVAAHGRYDDLSPMRITVSIGAAMVGVDDDGAALMRRADHQLLRAKRAGRKRDDDDVATTP
ncbi:MAG: diguanylate cyclase [Cellulomonas sp.]|uniref:sensor domain-containing diguanylate cyclase n=1 Tax=Cellulomonas sp. TaxID=40001 RepID=UPI0017C10DEC|nr:diguanylate cyclase [Cellulomonas sp.]NMM16294.1 diguanylate cyclase [Cellulomonas sp.]NMM31494.1 diguanylate cyclase [Cellulomonas sp.]